MNLQQLQKKYNLSDLELFTQNISSHKISFMANKLKQAETTQSSGSAVRLIQNKKLGFAANYGKSNTEELLNQALELSKYSENVLFQFPNSSHSQSERKSEQASLGERAEKLNPEGFKKIGEEIIDTVLKTSSCALTDVSFDFSSVNESIENSKDLNFSHSYNTYSLSINIRETLENNFTEIYTAIVDERMPDFKIYLTELLNLYNQTKKNAKIKTGSHPVLFTSKASKEILHTVETALNGKEVTQKSSPWHNRLGKQVLSKLITIKQDPDFGYMKRKFDDEGNLVKPFLLVNNGILENFYFDLSSGGMGNGFKPSLSTQPEPSLLNMILPTGKRSLNEMIQDIKYGLLVDQTMGGLSTNISGNMSVNVDIGFLIENGEIIGRVKDTMISGNIYTALNNVIELSNNNQWYWSNIFSPDMLVDGLMITAK